MTTFPVFCPFSTYLYASTICSSGNSLSITALNLSCSMRLLINSMLNYVEGQHSYFWLFFSDDELVQWGKAEPVREKLLPAGFLK